MIGSRFGTELFGALGLDPVFDDLLGAQLIDQVMFTPRAEYAFHHPMIRAVAYQAQLRSARAELHRRLAAAIEDRDPESADENSALIAEHLEAAGDVRAAYGWHMRAGAWATNRHIAAARISWERARQIADALPDGDPNGSRMRIAARTMLCGTGWRVHVDVADRFDELRELCDLAGDKSSLAIGLTGVVAEHMYYGRVREASRAASEQLALLDSIGDPALTVAVAFVSFVVKYNVDEADDLLRVSTSVIDAAGGDPAKGDLIMGSPLALALVWRGIGMVAGSDRLAPGP